MKKTIQRAWSNQFIKGGAIITATSFLANILNYFFNLLAARTLGPTGFGEISALFSYTAVFSIPMMVMSLVIINKIGSKGDNSRVFANALQVWFFQKLKRWWFVWMPFAVLIPLVPAATNLAPISGYALIPFIALNFLLSFYTAIVQGLQLFLWAAFIGFLTAIIKLTGAILVAAGVDGLLTVIIFLLFSAAIPLFVGHFVFRRNTPQSITPSENIQKRLSHAILNKYVIYTFLSILALTLFNNGDVIFVKKYFNAQEAGIYGSWSLFAKIILYVMGPLSLVSFIFFSDKKTSRNHERILMITLTILLVIASISFIFYRFFSYDIIRLLFGSKFDAVGPYLSQASIFGSAYTTISFINNYFLAKNSKRSLILAVCIPVYFIFLFVIPRSISSIITLNMWFSVVITVLYLVAYSFPFIYNGANGKKKG